MKDRLADYMLKEMTFLRDEYDALREIYMERNQLYAVLIKLMKDKDVSKMTVRYDEYTESNSHFLHFAPDDTNRILELTLTPNDDYNKINKEKDE